MRISRRPNMRASIENAPGPSRAMAVVRTITLSVDWLLLKVLNRTSAIAHSPVATATIGVMKPTNRQLAMMRMVTATSQPGKLSFADSMYVSV